MACWPFSSTIDTVTATQKVISEDLDLMWVGDV